MKLLRYGPSGAEKPAMLHTDGTLRDLSDVIPDIAGAVLTPDGLKQIAQLDPISLPKVSDQTRIGPCVGNVGKFLCIGLNYSDHAAEAGMPPPEHPVLFFKATSAICGPNDMVMMPRQSQATDWEVELGVVIGKPAKYVSAANALDHVAGYCVINDVSERDFQTKLSGQWTKGKSCDTFGPIGPWLVTADEVPDPQALFLRTDVNGVRRQTGTTGKMIFGVAEIIAHLSQLMTLHTGDVISTGTPPGVAMGMKPSPVYLKEGDVMELEIQGLGLQRQTVGRDR